MPLSRERKEELVAEYIDLIQESRAMIFTQYDGLDNRTLTDLRNKVREAGGLYKVTKLSLLELALQDLGYEIPEQILGVPVAVSFCMDEIPGVAKAVVDFADDTENLSVLAGMVDERTLSEQQIEAIADLPPLDDLRAQLLGMLDAPAARLVGVLQGGIANVVNVLDAYLRDQGEEAPAEEAA